MSPSYYHSAIAMVIGSEIMKARTFRGFSDLTLLIDGNDYTPDISVYSWKHIDFGKGKDIVKMEEMPLLAVEILSPTQNMNELFDKAQIYLQGGIQSVWIVQPFAHTISVVISRDVTLHHDGILTDVTGVMLDLAIVFEDQL